MMVGERWVGEVARWRAVLVQWRAMLEPGWEVEVLLYGGGGRQRTCRVAASTGGGVVGTSETPQGSRRSGRSVKRLRRGSGSFVRGSRVGWRFAVISSSRQLRRPDFLASQHSMVPPLRLRTAGACWLVRCEAIVSNAVAISTTASTRIMANAGSSSEIEKSHARRFLAPGKWGFFVSSGSHLTQNT